MKFHQKKLNQLTILQSTLCKSCLWGKPKGQKGKTQLFPYLCYLIFGRPVMKNSLNLINSFDV